MQSHKLSKKSLYLKIPFGFSVDYDVAKKKNPAVLIYMVLVIECFCGL